MVKDKELLGWKTPKNVLVVHWFCMCGGVALLRDLGVSKSVKREFLTVWSYPRFVLSTFAVCYCILLRISYYVNCL